MHYEIQKASMSKRISAFLFDSILTGIAIVAIAFLLSTLLGYDSYNEKVQNTYEAYEKQYGIDSGMTLEEYEAMTEEERQAYEAAVEAANAALNEDQEAVYNYTMMANLTLLIATISIFIGITAVEFVVPMLFGNGQTLGKKIIHLLTLHIKKLILK